MSDKEPEKKDDGYVWVGGTRLTKKQNDAVGMGCAIYFSVVVVFFVILVIASQAC